MRRRSAPVRALRLALFRRHAPVRARSIPAPRAAPVMKPTPPKRRRLLLLSAALVVALAVLVAQRLWFSPEAHEARLARSSGEQLEKQVAAGSGDALVYYYAARRRAEVGDLDGGIAALQSAL